MNYLRERIDKIIEQLSWRIEVKNVPIEGLMLCDNTGYKDSNTPPDETAPWKPFKRGDRFGGVKDWHGWFKAKVTIPEDMRGGHVEFSNRADRRNPQFIIYIDGKMVQGGDNNHSDFPIDTSKSEFDLVVYAYTGLNHDVYDYSPCLKLIDTDTRNLYYDLRVPYDVMNLLPADSKDHSDIKTLLNNAINLLDLRTRGTDEYKKSVTAARNYLKKDFYEKYCGKSEANVVCIGHSHIDTAWLWTFKQTKEKVQRTFATVLNMMREFPEYKFQASQAQLYQYLKEEAPELYEEVKKKIKEGRWEVEGAMWVEADCNLSGGESLVRQVLYGKRFFMEEFGVDSRVLWLPDVFGYSAALPQILKKSGVDRFVTSKISWNETNALPNDVFKWRGIDGTEILSYFLTAQDYQKEFSRHTTYNGTITPRQIKGTWQRFQQKELTNEVINTFGHGDGGGGPTREMVEVGKRLAKGIPGCPTVTFDTVTNFLNRLEDRVKDNKNLPTWVGELYLEYHRGTYTSQAKNKRYNRKSEFMYMNAELLSIIGNVLTGAGYPRNVLREGWDKIMLCQFHDVIPGSSIREVYEDSDKYYEKITADGKALIDSIIANIAANVATKGGLLVFNPNSFTGNGVVAVGDRQVYAENIPPKGYKVIPLPPKGQSTVKVNEKSRVLENHYFKVEFDKNYNIKSLFDKANNREIIREGERGNVLQAFEDFPRAWDAWEITNYYTEKMWEVNDVVSVTPIVEEVRAGFEVTKKFQESVITQKIYLYDDVAKVDFDTTADWKNDHILLKAAFPTDIMAEKATYDIQYGNVERPTHFNTSWEQAKFEVCAHKYGDLSDYGYGVSLINDCKYGYNIHDGVMKLTLIKSATSPDPMADKGHHEFTYTIYPHGGDLKSAGTIKLAYDLNNPMTGTVVPAQEGTLPEEYSLVKVDMDNIYIEATKPAEDSDDVVVRVFDNYNMKSKPTLTFGFDVKKAWICDMLENNLEELDVENNSVTITVDPFEIVTVKVSKK